MNRLEHLKATYLKNIKDNIDYPNVEFVLLNYSSKDRIDDWVANELQQYIDAGILNYYSIKGMKYFHQSHSGNIVFRLGSGEIICKIDADNFIGKGFAFYLNKCFSKRSNIFLSGFGGPYGTRDTGGKTCLLKKDLWATTGFDESMSGYGFEDIDLIKRLQRIGRKKKIIEKKEFLQSIKHDNISRIENEKSYINYHSIYIRYLSPIRSRLLVLYIDKTFIMGDLVLRGKSQQISLEKIWENGSWELKKTLTLNYESGGYKTIQTNNNSVFADLNLFNKIENSHFLERLKSIISIYTNKRKMQNNLNKKLIKVNQKGFGEGILTKNFKQIIQLSSDR